MTAFLKILLTPLVPVYALAVKIRNLFFDKSVFKSKTVNAKVVSAGNLTIGGSGKTPFVIYLTNLLKNSGYKPSVLSRGYGRNTKGYLLVSKDGEPLTKVQNCGDEIYHTVIECKVPAAVCENRFEGAKRLLKEVDSDIIVLDDGFQHRWIYRNLDIVLFDQKFLLDKSMVNQSLLPLGIMREGFASLNRADAIIINRKFCKEQNQNLTEQFRNFNKPVFTSYYKAISFVDMTRKTEHTLEEFEGQESLVISGIANPVSFLTVLIDVGVSTKNKIIFRDHKNYTIKEVQQIRKEFYQTNSHSVVTTEKDAVKLLQYSKEFDDIDIFYLKIALCMDDEESFKRYLSEKLN
ncbi:tetraacyldisaccharide 4'-kinase [Ignavibacterium sp.]|uniref:tetraacyldisaccharide 4'-kinase n=1 Tax=Ignavibacterium sp. TaxID=2651167 RepID=UPI00307E77DE